MIRFELGAIEQSVKQLHQAGASDYFKTFLVLKKFGLLGDHRSFVLVDTQNTQPALGTLFAVRGLTDFKGLEDRPFYEPFTNDALKEHAARSIVQTHVKRFHDKSIPFERVPWLTVDQMPDDKWKVSVSSDYPEGLGTGRTGLAVSYVPSRGGVTTRVAPLPSLPHRFP